MVYIIAMWAKLPTVELITKGIPVLCLIVWLWTLPRDRFANLIMAGLVVSLVADLVMQWDQVAVSAGPADLSRGADHLHCRVSSA